MAVYAEHFQAALGNDNSERFDALYFLAGGKPEMCDEISACSFGVAENGATAAIGEYAADCQPVDTSMGGFHVGGVEKEVASFTAVKIIDAPHEDAPPAPPPPPVSDDGTDNSAGDCIYPAIDMTRFENQPFAHIIANGQHAVVPDEIRSLATRVDDQRRGQQRRSAGRWRQRERRGRHV
ncbi:hypothetical protein CYMTET_54523 [Cymbomonas tetramitiformis]|uniref:Uncharacterized protein n=1 Tax=Cymbomonas tetramitiformis TaxID=36881 RepID=A0AAE0BER6_9CHLO|nr:hypothetical protein CYMTET_54523 [Cymbomonas tetramitiformis]